MSGNSQQRNGQRSRPQNGGNLRPEWDRAANDDKRQLRNLPIQDTFKTTPKGPKQEQQAKLIEENDITFCIGPAGTGKTHMAVVEAVLGVKSCKYKKMLLTRPAVEAGETLGFVPGSLNDKMASYMRPLYDMLDDAYGGRAAYAGYMRSEGNKFPADDNPDGPIEVCPPGMMRGRTVKDTIIIVDEAQNLKWEELKMIVTRLGSGSKMIITGDPAQIDLAPKLEKVINAEGKEETIEVTQSGLMKFIEAMEGDGNAVPHVGVHRYSQEDVMRHETVGLVVDRLEKVEAAGKKVKVNQTFNKPNTP